MQRKKGERKIALVKRIRIKIKIKFDWGKKTLLQLAMH